MKQTEIKQHNQAVVTFIEEQIRLKPTRYAPAYRLVVAWLKEGLTTSRGNTWTEKWLFRMLQRQGFRGLYGVHSSL